MKRYRREWHNSLPRDASNPARNSSCINGAHFVVQQTETLRWRDQVIKAFECSGFLSRCPGSLAWQSDIGALFEYACPEFLSCCPGPVAWPRDEGARFGCARSGFLSRSNQWLDRLHWSQLQLYHALKKVH